MTGTFAFLKVNSKKENLFVIPILFLLAILCFVIPSFSALPIFNYITIAIVAFLCILIIIWKLVFHKIMLDSFLVAIVCFNLAIFISNLFSKDATHIITYITLSGMAFCLYQFFTEKQYRKLIHYLILISFVLFALYFIVYYRQVIFILSIQRIGDRFDNLNTVGYYFLYAFVTSLSLINRKKIVSFLFLIPSFAFMFLLYRTGSRSALILSILSVFIFVFYFFKGKRVIIPILIDIGILIFGLVLAFVVEKLFSISIFSRLGEFFDTLTGEGTDYSSASRIELVIESFQLFLHKPIFGWGNNVFSIYSSERLFAHNNITELLCDFGLFGFVPFESIIVISYFKMKKYKPQSDTLVYCLLSLVCLFGIQFFYVNSQLKFDWIVLAFVFAEGRLSFEQSKEYLNRLQCEYTELYI